MNVTAQQGSGSTVIPGLRYRDARKAIDFLTAAFGFTVQASYDGPDGTIVHAQLTYGAGMLYVGTLRPEPPLANVLAEPADCGGRSTQLANLNVPDAAAVYRTAIAAGATVYEELAEMDYGGKAFGCFDLEGHAWWGRRI